MKNCHSSFTIMGQVDTIYPNKAEFVLKLLSGEKVYFHISKTTYYEVLRNVVDEGRDRVMEPDSTYVLHELGEREQFEDKDFWDAKRKFIKYLKLGLMVCIQGVCSTDATGKEIFNARRLILMCSESNAYGWEETHWWIQQINALFEQWLDVLFVSKREFTENDFAQNYRTNLDLLGDPTTNIIQECATMSRFLYGLSSAYLLTGNDRALSAAKACSRYLVNAYASPSHDGEYVFWKFGRVYDGKSTKEINASLNADDKGTYALYEQIYALSGLTQYYRATQDTWILGYIIRTIAAFQKFFLDEKKNNDPCYTGKGGYFSHIDPVTLRPDSPALDATGNKEKKNWNSVGDHIPAYLINLLVSIDPLPVSDEDNSWRLLREECRSILKNCVSNILKHFQPEDGCKFVKERFYKDWTFDNKWGWQQDRGIVGHNLKISWNLTRCGHYYKKLSAESVDHDAQQEYNELADRCYEFARNLGRNMREVGVDLIRGGIYDALERHPQKGFETDFAWGSTKDFWQQEQAILAYYIMLSIGVNEKEIEDFLQLARYCSAFWNLFFIDRDYRKIFFRTSESGRSVIEGQYGIQGGHALAGYHSFELSYLAHIYIRTYVDTTENTDRSFVLYYKPEKSSSIKSLNVLPDFFRKEDLKIIKIKINGVSEDILGDDQYIFQVDISDLPWNSVIMVEYLPTFKIQDTYEKDLREERAKISMTEVCTK